MLHLTHPSSYVTLEDSLSSVSKPYTRWKANDEIYQIYFPLHPWNPSCKKPLGKTTQKPSEKSETTRPQRKGRNWSKIAKLTGTLHYSDLKNSSKFHNKLWMPQRKITFSNFLWDSLWNFTKLYRNFSQIIQKMLQNAKKSEENFNSEKNGQELDSS